MTLSVALQKRLAGFTLDVALTVRRGATLALLGASGAGKSMTLKCIAGLETPDIGFVRLDERILFARGMTGVAPHNVKPERRRIGYLFQGLALFPTLTVAATLHEAMRRHVRDPGARDRAVKAYLSDFDLVGLERRRPHELSGGQAQRVAMARLLASAPEALLLDEPLSALDPELRASLRADLVTRLRAFDGYAILVTHDRDEAYRMASDLALIDKGRLVTVGSTASVFAQPGTLRAARLTGCVNISRANKMAPHTLYAHDWQTRLVCAVDVPDDTAFVGVRASHWVACPTPGANTMNVVHGTPEPPIAGADRIDVPLRIGSALVWRTAPYTAACSEARTLTVAPQAVMPLRDDRAPAGKGDER